MRSPPEWQTQLVFILETEELLRVPLSRRARRLGSASEMLHATRMFRDPVRWVASPRQDRGLGLSIVWKRCALQRQ